MLTIKNFSDFTRQRQRTSSDVFYCRGLPFQLLVESVPNTEEISAFLHCARTTNQLLDIGLDVVVMCEISILDQVTVQFNHKQDFVHCFSAGDDFGYVTYISTYKIQQLQADGVTLWHKNSMILRNLIRAEAPHCEYVKINNWLRGNNQSRRNLLHELIKFHTSCHGARQLILGSTSNSENILQIGDLPVGCQHQKSR